MKYNNQDDSDDLGKSSHYHTDTQLLTYVSYPPQVANKHRENTELLLDTVGRPQIGNNRMMM